ncbi:tetratricopeptide repeat protein [Candidatus Laterigemmans baculatus]|uniref:tetratricopeptide repeat protein n=1 Tax=Candidatus Laterigemmans baculatus TaxID=2770505 RepID=UPI001F2CC9A4|nr:tetratricopeptide repeat protein [Candidatus Laterigemmans baculatus]
MTDLDELETESGDADSPLELLSGKRVAFVGKLGGVSRREAMVLVRQQGAVAVESHDSDVDLVVIGAEESPLAEAELLGERWRSQAARGELEVIHETDFWQRLGMVEAEQAIRRLHTPAMLAHLLGVPVGVIRRWHRRGLIVPARTVHKLPYFDFTEVATARRLAELVAAGASPEAIERRLDELSAVLPDVERPLAQLSVLIEGKQILLRQGEGLIEPGGQLRIDFDALNESPLGLSHEPPPPVVSIESRVSTAFPIEQEPQPDEDPLLQHAYAAEDQGELEIAVDCYHAILGRDGARADICFQLAELLYRIGQIDAARERYYMAIELDETFVEARASLGSVLAETGHPELAVAAFEGALRLHDEYPDVHYNLARTLDELGRSEEAEQHWQQFLKLSPDSPWADEARERLG